MCIDGLALTSQRVKYCESMFNSSYMGMGYVSKIWVIGCPTPFGGKWGHPLKFFMWSRYDTVPHSLALATTAEA